MSTKKEFGDFQTPSALAQEVVVLLGKIIATPTKIVEPTCGVGAFLGAACKQWGPGPSYEGYEINRDYVAAAKSRQVSETALIEQQDFFRMDWRQNLSRGASSRVLVIGNPPWVTSSELGSLGSDNLPIKTNFQGLRGMDAKTGKANFDIAEWMIIRLLEALPTNGCLAMLCKTMTARKVLRHSWKTNSLNTEACLFLIDAKSHFNVSVDACLFFVSVNPCARQTASVYSTLDLDSKISEFGYVDGNLVSDVETYLQLRDLDGGSPYIWRSGLKHDASDVMELTPSNGHYLNGENEIVQVEPNYIYPLLKSSDLGNGRTTPRKHVIVPQKSTGDDTRSIRTLAPRTWDYLISHAEKLDQRKSSIYTNRPRFCVFGVGEYSFAEWKVAISGMYNNSRFVVVPPHHGKPVILDDTCYSIACSCEEECRLIGELLNSETCQKFLRSMVFLDSKRPITVDVLRRISIVALATRLGRLPELEPFIYGHGSHETKWDAAEFQTLLLMDEPKELRVMNTIPKPTGKRRNSRQHRKNGP